uniref:AA_permease_C domain-containing protein n=2 Tax=Macrostomum lignano TaxID=282301 RepID=A0A1I8GSB8_9PLAT
LAMSPAAFSLGGSLSYYATLLLSIVTRKKTVDEAHLADTKLSRCLGTLDLVALGVGSTLGAGVYVIAGEVAQKTTGPAVIVSFFIAAAASVLAGLCYAEFGARVPKSGSAYVYSYVTVGELMAFVIGWNLILEYAIGTASVARAWSQNFDSLLGGRVINIFRQYLTMSVPGIAKYPDFFAFGIVLLLTLVIAFGVKESAWVTKAFTLVNLMVLATVVIAGSWLADGANWRIRPGPNGTVEFGNATYAASRIGAGGFMPFGLRSIVSGAGTCFYAFVGFDAIATTGEEAKNPQKAIPVSIIVSLAICFAAYFSLSTVLTLIQPYFALDPLAPLPAAFAAQGWRVANYIIAVGAVCALSTSLLGAMFPLPRIVYAMASDGLLFRFLASVNRRLSTPLVATLITGLLSAVMACLFELKELVDMMSIGTLLAYTLVAISVLILRGNRDDLRHPDAEEPPGSVDIRVVTHRQQQRLPADRLKPEKQERQQERGSSDSDSADAVLVCDPHSGGLADLSTHFRQHRRMTWREYLRLSFRPESTAPTRFSESVNRRNTFLFLAAATLLAFLTENYPDRMHQPGVLLPTLAAFAACFGLLFSLYRQPENAKPVAFRVPAVPFVPCLSVFINVYLMMALPSGTWVRFLVWMTIGMAIYCLYGARSSTEHARQTIRKMRGIRLAIELDADGGKEVSQMMDKEQD